MLGSVKMMKEGGNERKGENCFIGGKRKGWKKENKKKIVKKKKRRNRKKK